MTDAVLLTGLIFFVSLLYSSVGHGGASGYLAAMALFGVAPPVMKPAALMLNLLVAGIATYRFGRAGAFSGRVFWPFAAASVPAALIGGTLTLPTEIYKPIVGATLVFAAWRLARPSAPAAPDGVPRVPMAVGLLCGAAIGLLSGLVGVGGGIFLSPILILMGWADPRRTAGVSAAFILVNSAAGLAGHWYVVREVPLAAAPWGVAAVLGGFLGAELGSRRLGGFALRRLLAVVLVIAGVKMMLL